MEKKRESCCSRSKSSLGGISSSCTHAAPYHLIVAMFPTCIIYLPSNRLFELEPEAKTLFGFQEDTPLEELKKSPKFVNHASLFVRMFDKAVEMIGPDTDMLTDILLDLGEKHVAYGVQPEYFPSMGTALIHSMKGMLSKEEFNTQVEQAWHELFSAMSYDMIRGQRRAKDVRKSRISNRYQTSTDVHS
jgi:hemoglobin-like flavoprotein